jgi:UDP-3-O-acyl-N-acetylglucosamine deacetylase
MIEHVMSSLACLEITDAEIEVDGPEMPILDGSAKEYFEGLAQVGSADLGQRSAVHLFSRVNVQGEGDSRIGISAGSGRWRYDWSGQGPWPGCLSCEFQVPDDYITEVAPARTFCYEAEIEMIKSAGLGKGGNEGNTLVLGADGYLTENRFTDEPPRHKLLDLIGDIALAGVPIRNLNVSAEQSGHALNVEAALRLSEVCKWEEPH